MLVHRKIKMLQKRILLVDDEESNPVVLFR
jgi:hypothetical protein